MGCKLSRHGMHVRRDLLVCRLGNIDASLDFNHPRSAILGTIASIYSLGAVAAIPFIPFVSDQYGRRRAILLGSVLIMIGALLQATANRCK